MATNSAGSVIGVIGAGTMGCGIAQIAATEGHTVKLCDLDQVACAAGGQRLRAVHHRLIDKGRLRPDEVETILSRIEHTASIAELAECEFVFEAIVEDLDSKCELIVGLGRVLSGHAVVATNTSSLSVSALAAAYANPGRVIGAHFFNPAPLMRLVEVIPALQTAETVVTKTRSLLQSWNKQTIVAKDTPGFIVNRLARPFYLEALIMLEEGLADVATIDWAMRECGGFRMGPFELMDLVGTDVSLAVSESIFAGLYYDSRFRPTQTQKRVVAAGYLGRKSGRGYYSYEGKDTARQANRDPALGQRIVDRVVVTLINGAAEAILFNLASADDIDQAVVGALNYPLGLMQWCDKLGVAAVVDKLSELYAEYGALRYRPSAHLTRQLR